MDTIANLPAAYPVLRQVTIGAHVLLAAWLVINGVAHQIGVLVKANAGSLREGASVPSLLAVGAGLLAAGVLVTYSVWPLARAASPSLTPAFLGAGLVAAVTIGIAMVYGTMFLSGTIALGVLDLALLIAHAALNSPAARGLASMQ
jgi:hypothetical protein